MGIWVWSFHSVCLRNNNELVDITDSVYYAGESFSTFWPDKSRTADLVSGTNFNNIVVFENQSAAAALSTATEISLKSGEIYWTTRDLRQYRRLNQHSGRYKWLFDSYPDNVKQFEEITKLKVVAGQVVPDTSSRSRFPDLYFDWGIS